MIHYSLTKDRMNPEKGGYIAKVSQWAKTDFDEIMDYMVAEGTGLTRPQALAYFEKLTQSFEHFIELRGGVSTPLCRVQTTISGVFRNKGTDNIRVNFYSIIRSNKIIFLVPPLPQGNYTIVVQAIMRMHKSVRGGALQRIITVS